MAAVPTQEDLSKCSICYEKYTNPRKLPGCLHGFCENCLLTYIANLQSRQEDTDLEFQCPICRRKTYIPKVILDDLPKWVKSLESKAGDTTGNMATSSSDGEESVRKVCISCEAVNKDTTAEKYCIECSEYLCATCSRIIHAIRKLTDHLVLDYNEEGDKGVNAVLADYFACSKHPGRIISLVCEEHNKLCCNKCLLEDHKGCDAVIELKDRANTLENEIDLNKLKEQFKILSEQISLIKESKKRNIETQKQKVDGIRNQIVELREKVNKIFDSLENDVCSQAKALVKEITITTDEEVQRLEHIGKHLELLNYLAAKVNTDGSDTHGLLVFYNIKAGILVVKDKVLAMRYSEDLELRLSFGDLINELAKLSPEDTSKLACVEAVPFFAPQVNFPEDQECFFKKTITEAKEFDIRPDGAPKDEPKYSDVQYLSDNNLFVVDCYLYNMCRLLDGQYMLIKSKELEKKPTRTTNISDKIMLTFENEKAVGILSEDLNTVGEISTKFIPKAICGMKNNRLAIAWCEPLAFGIVNLQETDSEEYQEKYKLKEVTYFDQDKAQRQFKSFDYIAVDERRGHVIQPCTVDKAVYGFELSGNPRFKYTHTELISPRGVACDSDGFIYVCEYKSNSVHILSPYGVNIQIVKEGIKSPTAVTVNAEKNELAVKWSCSPLNRITVFKIRFINK